MPGVLSRASLYLRYMREEHADYHQKFLTGQQQMLESLKHVRVDPDAKASHARQPPNPGPPAEQKDADSAPANVASQDLKKIYRKIVQETHPDKMIGLGLSDKEIRKRSEMYVKAVKAIKDVDEDSLIELAVDLDIELDLDEEKIAESLFAQAKRLEAEVQNIKNSVEWFWINANESAKIDIIKQICQKNGWIYVTDEQITESIRRVVGTHPGSRRDIFERARQLNKNRQIS